MLQLGAVIWCPTVDQQEVRWWDVYGEKMEAAKVSRQKLTASRAQFG